MQPQQDFVNGGEYNAGYYQAPYNQQVYHNDPAQVQNGYGYNPQQAYAPQTAIAPQQYGYQVETNGWVQPGSSGIHSAYPQQPVFQQLGHSYVQSSGVLPNPAPVQHQSPLQGPLQTPVAAPVGGVQYGYNEYGMPAYVADEPQPKLSLEARVNANYSHQSARLNQQSGGQAPKDVPGSGRYSPNRLPFSPHRVYKRSNKLSTGDLSYSGISNRLQANPAQQTLDSRLQQVVQQQGLATQAIPLNPGQPGRLTGGGFVGPAVGQLQPQVQQFQGPATATSGVYVPPAAVGGPGVPQQQAGVNAHVPGRLNGGLNPQPVPANGQEPPRAVGYFPPQPTTVSPQ